MPHLMEESASGAASSTNLRSSSRTARNCAGCFAKKPSIGAPKSAREETFFAGRCFALGVAFLRVVVAGVSRFAFFVFVFDGGMGFTIVDSAWPPTS